MADERHVIDDNFIKELDRAASGSPQGNSVADREIRLSDLLLVVARNFRMILRTAVLASIIVALYSLTLPNIYTGITRIMPPQQSQSSLTMMLGQLAPLASMAGKDLGLKSPGAIYVSMLQSRTVQDGLVDRFGLLKIYKTTRRTDARDTLSEASLISTGTDGLITIGVENRDPKLAADLANGYVEELQKLTANLAMSEAGQRRLFFEQQLLHAKEDLSKAELALKATQEKTGLIQLDSQAKMIIESVGALRGQITAKEVQLRTMNVFATDQNPDYIRVQQELASLRAQLSRLEQTQANLKGDIQVPTGSVPEAGLEYVRRFRDVKYYETLFEVMAKQYESAKLDEAKSSTVVQVLDPAVAPEKKSRPKRSIIVLVSTVLGGFFAMVYAFLKEAGKHSMSDPQQAHSWEELRRYLAHPKLLLRKPTPSRIT